MPAIRHPTALRVIRLFRDLRAAQGLTQDDVADAAGIHRTALGLIEREERFPSLAVALEIAKALGHNLSELLVRAEATRVEEDTSGDVRHGISERSDKPHCLRNEASWTHFTGLAPEALIESISNCYGILDTIDSELTVHGSVPIAKLVELANLSSMMGNIVGGALADASNGLYKRNKPHHYPDLIPQQSSARDLELKVALETNKPKGHLPKAGNYVTFRYVLGDKDGTFNRGKEQRGDTIWIWEVRIGHITIEDFDISNTDGDSGKTAVIKTLAFKNMNLVYFDPKYCPYRMTNNTYPYFN